MRFFKNPKLLAHLAIIHLHNLVTVRVNIQGVRQLMLIQSTYRESGSLIVLTMLIET